MNKPFWSGTVHLTIVETYPAGPVNYSMGGFRCVGLPQRIQPTNSRIELMKNISQWVKDSFAAQYNLFKIICALVVGNTNPILI